MTYNKSEPILRVSAKNKNTVARTSVFQDEDGKYRIDVETRIDGKFENLREDIQGPLDKDAYIRWLTQVLHSFSYAAADEEETLWILQGNKTN